MLGMWGRFLKNAEEGNGNPVCTACSLKGFDISTEGEEDMLFIQRRMEEMGWACAYSNHIDGMYISLSASPKGDEHGQIIHALLYSMPMFCKVEEAHQTPSFLADPLCIMMYGQNPVTGRLTFPHDAATFFGQDPNFLSNVEKMIKEEPESQYADLVFEFSVD
jgi:hypothetical protein